MFVGNCSIERIHAFMYGVGYAGWLENTTSVADDLYFGFNEWAARRNKIRTSHNWSSIFTFMSMSEAGAFELTKKEWAEYKASSLRRAKREARAAAKAKNDAATTAPV